MTGVACEQTDEEQNGQLPKSQFFFFGFICNCLNCNYHCDDHIFIKNQAVWMSRREKSRICHSQFEDLSVQN